jgi:hypothetical protein
MLLALEADMVCFIYHSCTVWACLGAQFREMIAKGNSWRRLMRWNESTESDRRVT